MEMRGSYPPKHLARAKNQSNLGARRPMERPSDPMAFLGKNVRANFTS
jgi:hypothetical protein